MVRVIKTADLKEDEITENRNKEYRSGESRKSYQEKIIDGVRYILNRAECHGFDGSSATLNGLILQV